MYTFDEIITGLRKPSRAAQELLRIYNYRDTKYNTEGTYIFDENWDNLIILDACRYDSFSKYNEYDGELQYRISRGSSTKEFLRGNFQGPNHYDTVYCSGNRWYQKMPEELDGERSEVFRFEVPEIPEYRLCQKSLSISSGRPSGQR